MVFFQVFIFLSGIVSGFLNTVAGGGSLLVLPLLVFSGLDMGVANATNRVAIFLQSVTATRGFARGGVLDFREMLPAALAASRWIGRRYFTTSSLTGRTTSTPGY